MVGVSFYNQTSARTNDHAVADARKRASAANLPIQPHPRTLHGTRDISMTPRYTRPNTLLPIRALVELPTKSCSGRA